THLFNAMSPFTHREPGMVGAALNNGSLYTGLIADGYHVDPAVIEIALAAKRGPARIFLVTDAMSSVGTDMTEFHLNGRRIIRSDGKLTLEDGTLAGADVDMHAEVLFMHDKAGLELEECLRMASLYPARCMGVEKQLGNLKPGAKANFVHLSPENNLSGIWLNGRLVDRS
ncbi:MAG: amidohydrolase family protein, partial [Rhizobiaceae bacterium]